MLRIQGEEGEDEEGRWKCVGVVGHSKRKTGRPGGRKEGRLKKRRRERKRGRIGSGWVEGKVRE